MGIYPKDRSKKIKKIEKREDKGGGEDKYFSIALLN